MEVWEVKCPGCKEHHEMRFRWDEKRPDLGGLRFDTAAGRVPNGRYNLSRVVATIRYQMPCGCIVRDFVIDRRRLVGGYRKTNAGALVLNRSWTYEAVSVAEIRWSDLVMEWLKAVKAMKGGDLAPMEKFVKERECRFWSDEMLPYHGQIVVNDMIKKDREGLPNRAARLWAADWQQGFKNLGELTHYWLVIEDVMENCTSQIVFEGMIATDEELVSTLDAFGCMRSAGGVDASKNTKQILSMCYREGVNAFSGITSHRGSFRHKDGVARFYSEEKLICNELNMLSKFEQVPTRDGYVPNPREPVIISYNKAGLLANHFFIRDMKLNILKNNPNATPADYIERVIPGDVSEDFQNQMSSWERVMNKQKKTNDDVEGFRKIRKADHMLMCCAYIDLLKEQTGLLGDQLARMGIERTK